MLYYVIPFYSSNTYFFMTQPQREAKLEIIVSYSGQNLIRMGASENDPDGSSTSDPFIQKFREQDHLGQEDMGTPGYNSGYTAVISSSFPISKPVDDDVLKSKGTLRGDNLSYLYDNEFFSKKGHPIKHQITGVFRKKEDGVRLDIVGKMVRFMKVFSSEFVDQIGNITYDSGEKLWGLIKAGVHFDLIPSYEIFRATYERWLRETGGCVPGTGAQWGSNFPLSELQEKERWWKETGGGFYHKSSDPRYEGTHKELMAQLNAGFAAVEDTSMHSPQSEIWLDRFKKKVKLLPMNDLMVKRKELITEFSHWGYYSLFDGNDMFAFLDCPVYAPLVVEEECISWFKGLVRDAKIKLYPEASTVLKDEGDTLVEQKLSGSMHIGYSMASELKSRLMGIVFTKLMDKYPLHVLANPEIQEVLDSDEINVWAIQGEPLLPKLVSLRVEHKMWEMSPLGRIAAQFSPETNSKGDMYMGFLLGRWLSRYNPVEYTNKGEAFPYKFVGFDLRTMSDLYKIAPEAIQLLMENDLPPAHAHELELFVSEKLEKLSEGETLSENHYLDELAGQNLRLAVLDTMHKLASDIMSPKEFLGGLNAAISGIAQRVRYSYTISKKITEIVAFPWSTIPIAGSVPTADDLIKHAGITKQDKVLVTVDNKTYNLLNPDMVGELASIARANCDTAIAQFSTITKQLYNKMQEDVKEIGNLVQGINNPDNILSIRSELGRIYKKLAPIQPDKVQVDYAGVDELQSRYIEQAMKLSQNWYDTLAKELSDVIGMLGLYESPTQYKERVQEERGKLAENWVSLRGGPIAKNLEMIDESTRSVVEKELSKIDALYNSLAGKTQAGRIPKMVESRITDLNKAKDKAVDGSEATAIYDQALYYLNEVIQAFSARQLSQDERNKVVDTWAGHSIELVVDIVNDSEIVNHNIDNNPNNIDKKMRQVLSALKQEFYQHIDAQLPTARTSDEFSYIGIVPNDIDVRMVYIGRKQEFNENEMQAMSMVAKFWSDTDLVRDTLKANFEAVVDKYCKQVYDLAAAVASDTPITPTDFIAKLNQIKDQALEKYKDTVFSSMIDMGHEQVMDNARQALSGKTRRLRNIQSNVQKMRTNILKAVYDDIDSVLGIQGKDSNKLFIHPVFTSSTDYKPRDTDTFLSRGVDLEIGDYRPNVIGDSTDIIPTIPASELITRELRNLYKHYFSFGPHEESRIENGYWVITSIPKGVVDPSVAYGRDGIEFQQRDNEIDVVMPLPRYDKVSKLAQGPIVSIRRYMWLYGQLLFQEKYSPALEFVTKAASLVDSGLTGKITKFGENVVSGFCNQ